MKGLRLALALGMWLVWVRYMSKVMSWVNKKYMDMYHSRGTRRFEGGAALQIAYSREELRD